MADFFADANYNSSVTYDIVDTNEDIEEITELFAELVKSDDIKQVSEKGGQHLFGDPRFFYGPDTSLHYALIFVGKKKRNVRGIDLVRAASELGDWMTLRSVLCVRNHEADAFFGLAIYEGASILLGDFKKKV